MMFLWVFIVGMVFVKGKRGVWCYKDADLELFYILPDHQLRDINIPGP